MIPTTRGRAEKQVELEQAVDQQRPRPERGAKSPRESEWGWGPTSIDK
jgi:hypothetical protein